MANLQVLPKNLPTTVGDLIAMRKTQFGKTINDLVEDVHTALWENEEYRNYLFAVYDEQAVEGSLATDNTMAAKMIRDYATKNGNRLSREKLATISKALNVVLRRYGLSRKERRNMVDGSIVPENNGDF